MVGFDLSSRDSYGNATIRGSIHDKTVYRDSKYAARFYQALLDPEAKSIRRKSGVKVPKRKHVIIYRAVRSYVRPSELTKDMVTCIPRKDAERLTEGFVPIMSNVIDTRRTFHAQTDPEYESYSPPYEKAPVTMVMRTRARTPADIQGMRRHNHHRDW